jgi:hypothetical protein
MSNENNLVVLEPATLSLNLNDRALQDLQTQRGQLREFIKSQLVREVDFGVIPGTPKACLYKPGAEKLAKLFRLGSRIVASDRELSKEDNFAMFTYRIEVFHIPTGAAIAQCEGSANSQEKKYKSRPAVDMINTLQKMAQKRAYVGAMIIATGASDFFTQDVEDSFEDKAGSVQAQAAPQPKPAARTVAPSIGECVHCGSGNVMVSIHQANTLYCRDCKKTQARA